MKNEAKFKKQLQRVFVQCQAENPDVVEWLLEVMQKYDWRNFLTAEERFFLTLKGGILHSAENPLSSGNRDNYVAAIKWYRGVTGAALKEAKDVVDKYVHEQKLW